MTYTDSQLLDIATKLRDFVVAFLPTTRGTYLTLPGDDLKGEHGIDERLSMAVIPFFESLDTSAELRLEGHGSVVAGRGAGCFFVDPVDGSLNRDLGVGDPGFVLAYADKMPAELGDLRFGFVHGLFSGDSYYTLDGRAYWKEALCGKRGDARVLSGESMEAPAARIACDSSVKHLRDAILYFNDGYGPEMARAAHRRAGNLIYRVKHRCAFDNAATEICCMARGTAHLRVEARSHEYHGRLRGSDHANLLAAMTIGRAAGLVVSDLEGNSLDGLVIDLDRVQDFACASSVELLNEAVLAIATSQGPKVAT